MIIFRERKFKSQTAKKIHVEKKKCGNTKYTQPASQTSKLYRWDILLRVKSLQNMYIYFTSSRFRFLCLKIVVCLSRTFDTNGVYMIWPSGLRRPTIIAAIRLHSTYQLNVPSSNSARVVCVEWHLMMGGELCCYSWLLEIVASVWIFENSISNFYL